MRNPFQRIRDFFRKPAMIGTPPSLRPKWHDPKAHARNFAERYAEPMNYHGSNTLQIRNCRSDVERGSWLERSGVVSDGTLVTNPLFPTFPSR